MRKLLLIPILLTFFVSGCGQSKDHAYVRMEPAVFIPATTTTTTLPPTTTTTKPTVIREPVKQVSRSLPKPRPNAKGFDGACGGNLPPCWVLENESGGNLSAYNASGCAHKDGSRGCYGKWQCDPQTCDGTGSAEEQNAEAARVWDNGKGCSHWNAC